MLALISFARRDVKVSLSAHNPAAITIILTGRQPAKRGGIGSDIEDGRFSFSDRYHHARFVKSVCRFRKIRFCIVFGVLELDWHSH